MTDTAPIPTQSTPDDTASVTAGAVARLGAILPQTGRDAVYVTYGGVGIVLAAITNYLSATQHIAPEWLVGGVAAYASVGVFVALIARANPSGK